MRNRIRIYFSSIQCNSIHSVIAHSFSFIFYSFTQFSGAVIKAGSGGLITDASGKVWTITSGGQVAINGVTNTTSANILLLIDAQNLIWQQVPPLIPSPPPYPDLF
jgi:hypothetical protein